MRVDPRRRRSGGALVEFSVSVVVLWLIVAATLDLGRAFAASHVLQSAARSAARELALDAEIPWNEPFEDAVERIFDSDYLVVDADCLEQQAAAAGRTPGSELAEILRREGLLLNQMLRPLMVFEHVSVGGTEWHLLRYPGALLSTQPDPTKDCTTPFTVGIPEVDAEDSRVTFHAVVEEIEPDAFSLGGEPEGALPAGTVALRLLYPFQAVGLSGWRVVDGFNKPVLTADAEDYAIDTAAVDGSTIAELDTRGPGGAPQAYALRAGGDPIPVYGGSLGLGVQGVLGQAVRPFRRVLEAQAVAAREAVGEGS